MHRNATSRQESREQSGKIIWLKQEHNHCSSLKYCKRNILVQLEQLQLSVRELTGMAHSCRRPKLIPDQAILGWTSTASTPLHYPSQRVSKALLQFTHLYSLLLLKCTSVWPATLPTKFRQCQWHAHQCYIPIYVDHTCAVLIYSRVYCRYCKHPVYQYHECLISRVPRQSILYQSSVITVDMARQILSWPS